LLVRHGQATANVHGLLLGRPEPPAFEGSAMSGPGRVQPTTACRQTVAVLAAAGAVEIDPRWIEMDR
jgi:broad specificity phosphatase PhoE